MANQNFFRVMQGGTWQVEDTESINFDFSCNNSTTVNLSTFSSTYTASSNFRTFAAHSNTYSHNDGSYLYASKYTGVDEPDQMIQMFEYKYTSSNNLGFPRLDDITDNVEGNGVKRWFIDNDDTIYQGFPDGNVNKFGFKQDIIIARENNFNNSPTRLLVDAYKFSSGINYTKIYQISMSSAWDISTVNTNSINTTTVVNDYNSYSSPVPTNKGMGFNNDGTKLFHYQTGRRGASTPLQMNRWLTVFKLNTAYDLSDVLWTESIDLNDKLGFDPRFFNTSMQVFYNCTNADGSFNYNCNSGTIKDIIRIYSGSFGGSDNEVYFEIENNYDIANISSSYTNTPQGQSYHSTSNIYTFNSTASADGTTNPALQYANELVFAGGALSLTQCEWTTHPIVIV